MSTAGAENEEVAGPKDLDCHLASQRTTSGKLVPFRKKSATNTLMDEAMGPMVHPLAANFAAAVEERNKERNRPKPKPKVGRPSAGGVVEGEDVTKLSYSLPSRLVNRVKKLADTHQITVTELLRMATEIGLPEVEKAFPSPQKQENSFE